MTSIPDIDPCIIWRNNIIIDSESFIIRRGLSVPVELALEES
jgi:hypothetical protein